MDTKLADTVFGLRKEDLSGHALEVFEFQYRHNPTYQAYVDLLRVDPAAVRAIHQIPFLPISLFKSKLVQTTIFDPEIIFESSGTTQEMKSRHLVKHISIYQQSFTQAFEKNYGPVDGWCILGLLPSYLEQGHSSLVYMVESLVTKSGHPQSGFYLYEFRRLFEVIQQLEEQGQPTLLIGVTFALLDFAETCQMALRHTLVIETGGMKGRRKELTRPEVHDFLKQKLGVDRIHSEYGMTELLSQAYSKGEGVFLPPPWMQVLVRADDDPSDIRELGGGMINVIDLANIFSCSFIATDDLGRVAGDGSFEVLGRADNSDLRGCNLMLFKDQQ